jgi:hypothetical protein
VTPPLAQAVDECGAAPIADSRFRPRDRQSMLFAFDLWSPADVKAHAAEILGRLRSGTMPCDGAWPKENTDVVQRWTESGFQP